MSTHKFGKGWEFSRIQDETVWRITEVTNKFGRPLYKIKHVNSSKTDEKFESQLEDQFRILG